MSVYVRARDGALYRNPIWVFPEGFICFDETEPPELVLWLDPHDLEGRPDAWAAPILCRVFGFETGSGDRLKDSFETSADILSIVAGDKAQRAIPAKDPIELVPAASYFFGVTSRPPRPTIHEGTERYANRLGGAIWDWPAGPFDASSLEISSEKP